MSATAIVIFSDPKSGSEEALGRVFNALVLALSLKERGEEVSVIFQGTGTRWPAELVHPTHPVNGLYQAVQENIFGVSGACADLFGAADSAVASGQKLIRDRALPGTAGLLDLSAHLSRGNLIAF